jgi:hypothetical protein
MEAKNKDGGPAFPTDSEAQVGVNTWHFEGMSLRDYFIAHAPVEPQRWFRPVLPTPETPLPTFATMYPDETDEEFRALKHFDSDFMDPKDVKEERVRNYLFQKNEQRKRQSEYRQMAERELYVQWPAAWADAMLKAREA